MPSSKLYPGELIIDDSTPDHKFIGGEGMSTGYFGMFRSAEDMSGFSALDPKWLVDSSEWQPRCEEMDTTKTRISDLRNQAGMKPKNQKSLSYCWIFGPTGCVETMRCVQGEKYVSLSPASRGAVIKNGRNVGGWGQEAFEGIAKDGLVPSEDWPDTSLDLRKYNTVENRAKAQNYKAVEWDVLVSGATKETSSCLFHRKPVAIGLGWWGHLVYAVDPVWLDGELCWRCVNSWGDIPDYPNGYFILRGRKMTPNDACCPRSVSAS